MAKCYFCGSLHPNERTLVTVVRALIKISCDPSVPIYECEQGLQLRLLLQAYENYT